MSRKFCQFSYFTIFIVKLIGLAGWPSTRLIAQSFTLPQPEVITAKEGLPQAFVPAIAQDKQGFIWMATRDGLCRYDGHQFKVFQPVDNGRPSLSSLGLTSLLVDHRNRIWLFSDQNDIDVFDPLSETFTNFSKQPFYQHAFRGFDLIFIYPDRQNRLWLHFENRGLVCLNLSNNQIHWYRKQPSDPASLSSDTIRTITEDRSGTIWIGTINGLDRVQPTGQFIHYKPQLGLPDSDIYAIKERDKGNLLLLSANHLTVFNAHSGYCRNYPLPVGSAPGLTNAISTDSRGNDYFNRMDALFRFNEQDGVQLLSRLRDIQEYKSLFVDRSDVLWLGTDGQGVRKFNLRAGLFQTLPYQHNFCSDLLTHFLSIPKSQQSVLPANLFAYNFRYAFDQQGKLWFNAGSTPFYQVDLQTKSLKVVPFPVNIPNDNKAHHSISLATDPEGRIWAIHDTLVRWYEKGQWHRFPHPLRPGVESAILQVVVDKQALWLATSASGLYRVDRRSGQIRQYAYQPGNKSSLRSNNLYCLFADPFDANRLWVGTFGNGLGHFDKRTGLSRWLTKQNGLPNNVIYAAIPDRRGFIWVATNQGLCRVDRATFQTRTYTREDGLLADEFNRFHFLHLPNDRILLGGLEGITAFDPGQSQEDTYQPPVQVTAIQINNQPLLPGELTAELPVSALKQLRLAYWQNFLTVSFAAMQYNRQNKIRYRYQLKGLDQDWIITDRTIVDYTDLRPGQYVLRLNASNTSGVWSRDIRSLTLVIHPPWWATWWAYSLYALVLAGVGYALLRIYLNRLKLQQSIAFAQKEIELKKKESEHLREVDEMKTNFFSNITHEFRTPLTLILTPAQQLKEHLLDPQNLRRLETIDRNAHQLLGLVNQLLDLSKLEANALPIQEVQGDLVEFINQIVGSFESQAETKSIQLRFQTQLRQAAYWFDSDKLERIVTNLVANALKFTPEEGTVDITLTASPDGVYLTVSDTGIGIPPDKLSHIFDRFYQVDDSSTRRQEGTGIGLALVKELVQLQGGTIRVSSNQAGYTTIFSLKLPYRSSSLPIPPSRDSSKANGDTTAVAAQEEPSVVLLVEDNTELAEFIADSLPKSYCVHRASTGIEGLTLAQQLLPDLVISDVLMPGMDGYTLCQELKSNLQTSHIPIILLTAKAALDSRIEGLQLGADDYVTKPFHLPELRLRVRNLLQRQQRLRDYLRAELSQPETSSSNSLAEFSDPFLTRLYTLLESHLDDTEFGVTELASEIGMSNSTLNRKLSVLTGLSAVELMRNYRLNRATHYLKEGKSISEAAYSVGFNNLSYFTRCFREFYHMTPREFTAQK